jgi:hypothetical protein
VTSYGAHASFLNICSNKKGECLACHALVLVNGYVHRVTSLVIGAHNSEYISSAATYVCENDSEQLP